MKPTTIAKLKDAAHKEHFNTQVDFIIQEFILQADSRERVKEALAELKERLEISPTIVRKLAKAKMDDTLNDLIEANSELVSLTAVIEN